MTTLLNQIKIASPCSADWEQMQGHDRVRFCDECTKNVFNLSAMTRRDAEALLRETNGNVCTRLFRRQDRTVLTEDCPVGIRVKLTRVRRRVGWAIAGAMGLATACAQEKNPVLSGVVDDQSGASMASAKVSAIDVSLKKTVTVFTDVEGRFRFDSLEPGNYDVVATFPGFAEFREKKVVLGKGERRLNIIMQIGVITMGRSGSERDGCRNTLSSFN